MAWISGNEETPSIIGNEKTPSIRPVERYEENRWIWKEDEMIRKTITFVPLLYQIFDGVLLSAADVRKGVKHILVKIDAADNSISFWTHGEGVTGISCSKIRKAMEFSCSLRSYCGEGNKDDHITDQDNELWQKVRQTIRKFSPREKWWFFSFKLDLAIFGLDRLEDDMVALMKKRVVDLAGCCSGLKVELEGTCHLPSTFQDYVLLYLEPFTCHSTRIFEKVNDTWEICVAVADGHLESFEQVSFVNNFATTAGGSHVDYIANQITDHLAYNLDLTPDESERYLWVFVNAHIDNPSFDLQAKESLATNEGSFRSTCELTQEFLQKIADSSVFKRFERKLDIPELQDANLADTPHSQDCTLILTTGVFSTPFMIEQLRFLGRDKYGMFPFEGKLLNVREATHEQLEENTGIQNIMKILGLQRGKIYENVNKLRYGRLMIMTDEDLDGLEFKGLLINFLHCFWPSLLKVKNFLSAFIVPFARASHKVTTKVLLFYSMPDYEVWHKRFGDEYYKKFYKESKSEKRGRYSTFDQRVVDFVWENDEDGRAIELVFSPMKINERSCWLQAPRDDTDFDLRKKSIRYLDFINQEFKQFAVANFQRSITSMVDGLKAYQRKILFYAFKKPIIQGTVVAHFTSYVLEHSPYNEGKASLVGINTIIGMAQNYVGSNNINLLQLNGRVSTSFMDGHADGALLLTWLSPITRYIFHQDDELFLVYLREDGQFIEPEWFIPIIPMALVNGSEARGASFIPNYNPRDVIANLMRLLDDEKMMAMLPWYRGFKGDIKETKTTSDHTSYTANGKLLEDVNGLTITELPLRTSTEDYRNFLKEAASREDINGYTERNCTTTSVHFEITMTGDQMSRARKEEGGLLNTLKLTTTLSTDNMYLFDEKGQLKKYDNPQQILQDFFHINKRKTDLLRPLRIDSLVLRNKLRFSKELLDGKHPWVTKFYMMDAKCAEFEASGFQCLASIEREVDQLQEVAADASNTSRYDYLLSINPMLLDDEYIEKLQQELDAKDKKIAYLKDTSIKDLWRADLQALDHQLEGEGYPKARFPE